MKCVCGHQFADHFYPQEETLGGPDSENGPCKRARCFCSSYSPITKEMQAGSTPAWTPEELTLP